MISGSNGDAINALPYIYH